MEDKIVAILILVSCILLLAVLGIIFLSGRGSFLIAGFNTKSPEEKSEYEVPALCRFMGKIVFALAPGMLFWVLGVAREADWMFAVGTALFVAITFFAVIYINTGDRFKK